jgi:hypothetical protein
VVAKAHSKATKLAAVVLARLSSADVAAVTFGVDVQTVRRWQAGADAPPDDTWTAVRDVLLTRGAEMAARGETSGLVQTLTAAGISDRNVRYSTLIARREARRAKEQQPEPESPKPWRAVFDALPHDRRRLLVHEFDVHIAASEAKGNAEPVEDVLPEKPDEDTDAWMLRYCEALRDASPADIEARTAVADGQQQALDEAEERERQERYEAAHPRPEPSAPLQVPPGPSRRLLAPTDPRPAPPYGLHVVSDAELNDPTDYGHPSWRRIE